MIQINNYRLNQQTEGIVKKLTTSKIVEFSIIKKIRLPYHHFNYSGYYLIEICNSTETLNSIKVLNQISNLFPTYKKKKFEKILDWKNILDNKIANENEWITLCSGKSICLKDTMTDAILHLINSIIKLELNHRKTLLNSLFRIKIVKN